MLPEVEAYRQETHGDTLRYNDILEVVTAANAAIDALEAECERLRVENIGLRNCENCAYCSWSGETGPCMLCRPLPNGSPSGWEPIVTKGGE